jgi:hypothetical protein
MRKVFLISIVAISFAACTPKQSNVNSVSGDSTKVDSITVVTDSVAQIPDSI